MSISTSALTAYVDQLQIPIVKEAFFGSRIFKFINLHTGIKGTQAINVMTSTLTLQSGAGCTSFNPTSNEAALLQRNLTVCDIKVEGDVCWNTLQKFWLGAVEKMDGSYNETLPNFFESVYVADKVDKIGVEMERLYLLGDTSGSGNLALCDGLLKYLSGTSAVVKVFATSGNAGQLTSANAIAAVKNIIAARPNRIKGEKDQTLWASLANWEAIYLAYFETYPNNPYLNTVKYSDYEFVIPGTNVTVKGLNGMDSDVRMFLTPDKNLHFGTDSLSDVDNFQLWYEKKDDKMEFRAKWKQGFAVSYPSDVVLYTGATS